MRTLLSLVVGFLALCLVAGCGAGEEQGPERQAKVRFAELAEGRIAWYERGQGPPLVMLIGTGSTMSEWDPALLELLERDHRLLLVDYPGVGLSGPWRGRSFDGLADAISEWMGSIGVERADVLGWSMGGFVAQRLAVRAPTRVRKLVLAGTNPGGPEAVLGSPKVQRIDSLPDPSDKQILSELYPPGEIKEGWRFLRRLETASEAGTIPEDFRVSDRTVKRQVAAEDPWLRSGHNFRQLSALKAPLLAAAGDEDEVTPAINMRRISAQAPEGRFRLFSGSHAFLFQEREDFVGEVQAFLSD